MSMVEIPMKGVDVMLAIPAGRDFDPATVRSIVATFIACQQRGIAVRLGMVANCSVIEWARDEIIDLFLESPCNALFCIDSDMVWEPEQFIRMLVLNQIHPVVCASYPAKKDAVTYYINRDENEELVPDEMGLVEVWGVGLGFTVIRREVIDKLVGKSERVKDEITGREFASVFRVGAVNGGRRGEDMAFFSDIRDLGYKVKLDPSIDLGHIGRKVYRGCLKDALLN